MLVFWISLGFLSACITTVDQKISMVNAAAMKDLNCYDDPVQVVQIAHDRFGAQCVKQRAFYFVRCSGGPKTCQVKRAK
jgi:hypothetical protein